MAAVTGLIRDAMAVADGEVPDLDEPAGQDRGSGRTGRPLCRARSGGACEVMKVRLTPLDPLRPARDILEDLLSGIQGCQPR
jgi:hypothetical protein